MYIVLRTIPRAAMLINSHYQGSSEDISIIIDHDSKNKSHLQNPAFESRMLMEKTGFFITLSIIIRINTISLSQYQNSNIGEPHIESLTSPFRGQVRKNRNLEQEREQESTEWCCNDERS